MTTGEWLAYLEARCATRPTHPLLLIAWRTGRLAELAEINRDNLGDRRRARYDNIARAIVAE